MRGAIDTHQIGAVVALDGRLTRPCSTAGPCRKIPFLGPMRGLVLWNVRILRRRIGVSVVLVHSKMVPPWQNRSLHDISR